MSGIDSTFRLWDTSLEDPLRAKLYSEPKHFYRPTELMSVPWVAGHTKEKPRSVESRFEWKQRKLMEAV